MAECSLFMEDEVYVHKQSKGYVFGLIVDNSESLSSSDETEDEETSPEDRVVKGTVRVSWHPSGKETVIEEKKVCLADRSLMPGDVVRRLIPGQESQSGYVMNMDVTCHLHVKRSNKFIYNVNSKDLMVLQKFESGQDVMLDSWLGKVENVDINLILVFCDGARCQVEEDEVLSFTDVNEKRDLNVEFGLYLFYPGQELRGFCSRLTDAKWLNPTPRYCHKTTTSKRSQKVNVRVEKVITKSVEVVWVFRGYEKTDEETTTSSAPPRHVQGEALDRLQVLDWFRHCTIQIADRLLYRIKNDDVLEEVEPRRAYDPKTAMCKSVGIKVKEQIDQEASNKSPEVKDHPGAGYTNDTNSEPETGNDECGYEDVDTDDEEEEQKGASAQTKAPSGGKGGGKKKMRGAHKGSNIPAKFKAAKQGPKNAAASGVKKICRDRTVQPDDLVEVEVELTTSWATVMWQDGSVEKDIPSVDLFPVHHLDELEFFPGDYILPSVDLDLKPDYGVVASTDHAERTCIVHWFKAFDVGKANEPILLQSDCEVSVYDIKDHPDYKFRPSQCVVRVSGFEQMVMNASKPPPAVGQVFELGTNGKLKVKWSTGSVSECYPQEIFIASDDNDDVSDSDSWESESDYDSDDSSETWETESEQEIIGEDDGSKSEKNDSGCDPGTLMEHKKELDALLERAHAAVARLNKLLNSYDVSLSAPECYHDIIRVYRSCHDLDRNLRTSFFNDPELQSLIAQARKEVKRDKENKTQKQLSHFFESWSKSLPESDSDFKHFGTLAVGDKTYKVGTDNGGTVLKFSVDASHSKHEKNSSSGKNESDKGASAELVVDAGSESEHDADGAQSEAAAAATYKSFSETRAMRKEYSEPAISKSAKSKHASSRRPSDPTVDNLVDSANKKKYSEVNLVGENCVVKASKRTKSDSCDNSGMEAKKSRDEMESSHNVAQELCNKICLCLQKQVLNIYNEMQKRSDRLMANIADDETSKSKDGADAFTEQDSRKGSPEAQIGDKLLHENNLANQDSQGSAVDEVSSQEPAKIEVSEKEIVTNPCNGSNPEESVSEQKEEETSPPFVVHDESVPCKGFVMLSDLDQCHRYASQDSLPINPRVFRNAVRKELNLFQSSLTDGIFIKGFEKRLDLYSVMVVGPQGTPYEDGLFFFDFKLPDDYPNRPPLCHYYSFCNERLNPNLYEDGKVCISLLGTWQGKGTEMWTSKSNLLQVLLSVQGLILVSEPYYNEAGYEKQRGTQLASENSRVYNEMAVLKTVQSLTRMCQHLPILFKDEARSHLLSHGHKIITRLRSWMEINHTQRKGNSTAHVSCSVKSEPSDTPNGIEKETNSVPSEKEVLTSAKLPSENLLTLSNCETGNEKSQFEHNSQSSIEHDISSHPEDVESDLGNNSYESHRVTPQKADNISASFPDNQSTDMNSQPLSCNAVDTVKVDDLCQGAGISDADMQTSLDNKATSDETPTLNGCSNRSEGLIDTVQFSEPTDDFPLPDFPLFPMSRGFCLTLSKFISLYATALEKLEQKET